MSEKMLRHATRAELVADMEKHENFGWLSVGAMHQDNGEYCVKMSEGIPGIGVNFIPLNPSYSPMSGKEYYSKPQGNE